MLKIRLRRVGKRNQPSYRVVVVEHTKKVQGSYLEALGTYNPRARAFAVNEDRVLHWLDNGAQPSERIAKLLTSVKMKHKLINLPDYDRKPKRKSKKAQPEAATVESAANETEEPVAETPAEEVPTPTEETTPTEEPSTPEEKPQPETPEKSE